MAGDMQLALTVQSLLDASAEIYARLTRLLNTPGLTDKMRRQVERELKKQERVMEELKRLLG